MFSAKTLYLAKLAARVAVNILLHKQHMHADSHLQLCSVMQLCMQVGACAIVKADQKKEWFLPDLDGSVVQKLIAASSNGLSETASATVASSSIVSGLIAFRRSR